jgi:hypothetical protein
MMVHFETVSFQLSAFSKNLTASGGSVRTGPPCRRHPEGLES